MGTLGFALWLYLLVGLLWSAIERYVEGPIDHGTNVYVAGHYLAHVTLWPLAVGSYISVSIRRHRRRQAEHLEFMRAVRDRVVAEQKTADDRRADFERRLAQGIRRPRTFKLEDK